MVVDRVGTNNQHAVGIFHCIERCGNRTRPDTLEQGRYRRGMTQPGTMIDIVGTKTSTHQFLEDIGLFITAFCRPESSQRRTAFAVPYFHKSICSIIQRFIPARFAKMRQRIRRIKVDIPNLCRFFFANQGGGQPVRMPDVVESESALDTQAVTVGRAFPALHRDNFIVLYLVGNLATHSAIGTDAMGFFQGIGFSYTAFIDKGGLHEGPGGADLDTFSTCHTGTFPHGIIKIKNDFCFMAAVSHANYIINLDFAAGPGCLHPMQSVRQGLSRSPGQ